MNIVQFAGSLARRADFQTYVREHSVPPRDVDADAAAQFIREACGVQSRRELATNHEAAHRFEIHVRRPFMRWAEQQHNDLRRAA